MDSFLKWIGGKKLLREEIISRFPEDTERYIEVCGGAGWVMFAREKHAKFEVFNDIDSNLINLYRCIKYHAPELHRQLEMCLHSRENFNNYKKLINMEGLTDIQRAAMYFVLIRGSFGANRSSFATEPENIVGRVNMFTAVQKRLQRVVIEHRDFADLINTYDREKTLFYIDPPYYKAERYYSTAFTTSDHKRLAAALAEIKGRFTLSYNDCDFVRDLYAGFKIEEVTRTNNLAESRGAYRELIITNYN